MNRPHRISLRAQTAVTPRSALAEFLDSLEGPHRKPATITYYRSSLRQLVGWMENNNLELRDLTNGLVRKYFTFREKTDGAAPLTLYHDWVCTRKYFSFCRANGYLHGNPMGDLVFKHPHAPPPEVPSSEQCEAILQAIRDIWNPEKNPACRYSPKEHRDFIMRRDYCIALAHFDSGARLTEIVSRKTADLKGLDQDKPYLMLTNTKTKKDRRAWLSPRWVQSYRAYLKVRPEAHCEEIFVSSFAEAGAARGLKPSSFCRKFKRYAEFAGYPDFTTRWFRRHRGSLLVQTESDLFEAAEILGNSPQVLRDHYLERNQERLRERWLASVQEPMVQSKRAKRTRLK